MTFFVNRLTPLYETLSTPMKIREYFVSMKQQMEEYNERLSGEVSEKKSRILALERQISDQHDTMQANSELTSNLAAEKKALETKVAQLEWAAADARRNSRDLTNIGTAYTEFMDATHKRSMLSRILESGRLTTLFARDYDDVDAPPTSQAETSSEQVSADQINGKTDK